MDQRFHLFFNLLHVFNCHDSSLDLLHNLHIVFEILQSCLHFIELVELWWLKLLLQKIEIVFKHVYSKLVFFAKTSVITSGTLVLIWASGLCRCRCIDIGLLTRQLVEQWQVFIKRCSYLWNPFTWIIVDAEANLLDQIVSCAAEQLTLDLHNSLLQLVQGYFDVAHPLLIVLNVHIHWLFFILL